MNRLLALAACWATTAVALAPGSAWAAEHTVTMAGMTLNPASISARVGDSVRFVNDDSVDHDMFVPTVGHGVNLGMQKPGAAVAMMLGKSGDFEVECVLHPHMLAKVSVTK